MNKHHPTTQDLIRKASCIVIKVGTDSIMADGDIDRAFIAGLVKSIVDLKRQGKEVILVSSGAIGVGVRKMAAILGQEIDRKSLTLEEKQKAAMIGQPILMAAFAEEFEKHGFFCGQALLDKHDIAGKIDLNPFKRASLNLPHDQYGMNPFFVPIINENDPLATDEITFGDNDILSGLIAGRVLNADLQILGSDVCGLHMKNPKKKPNRFENPTLSHVWDIYSTHKLVSDTPDTISNGGASSKIISATLAANAGVPTILTRAKNTPDFIDKLRDGIRTGATIFMPPPQGFQYALPPQFQI